MSLPWHGTSVILFRKEDCDNIHTIELAIPIVVGAAV